MAAYTRFEQNAAKRALATYEAGRVTALKLRPGDKFTGAFGAARDAGHKQDEIMFSMFVSGYMSALPTPIITDANNVILQIGDKHK